MAFIQVKEGVSGNIVHAVRSKTSVDAYISEQIDRIDVDNHYLMQELCSFAVAATDRLDLNGAAVLERVRAQIVCAGIIVYRMLESQAEADELEET